MAARFFTDKQKRAVALASGQDVDGLQADHIKPYSAGGETDVSNCQLISPIANSMKGSAMLNLREWQDRFLRAWELRTPGESFLLVAIPGGGKTYAALTAASRWLRVAADRRLLIVVPTANLQEQWRDEAVAFGVQLETKDHGTGVNRGFSGWVVTYSWVAQNSMAYRKITSICETMSILDEVHHCGDDTQWGKNMRSAIELCREKLLLSGTPFRSDGTQIPFVSYDGDGFCVANFRYDYPDALKDQVVRWLAFEYSRSIVTYTEGGDQKELQLNAQTNSDDASRALSLALNPRGVFLRNLIGDAHAKLCEVRRTIPDAGAMAACKDTGHAEAVAKLIKEVTGCTPAIAVSNEDVATSSIKAFRKSSAEWLVSVRQVSEGTDIKRLQVLCYFTNYTTDMFFRQLIGRVSRTRELEDYEGYVFLPADPRLIECARRIEDAQVVALREICERERKQIENESSDQTFMFDGATHDGIELAVIGNAKYSRDEYRRIEAIARLSNLTLEQVARAMAAAESYKTCPPMQMEIPQPSLEEQMQALKIEIKSLVGRAHHVTGKAHADIHLLFSPRQDLMTVEQLKSKAQAIRRMIAEGR